MSAPPVPMLSVVIPIYNERSTIEEILWRVQQVGISKAFAVHHFERALALRPGDAGLQSNLRLALLKTGRPSEAIPHFVRALERNSADVETRVHLGVALTAVGKLDEAIDELRQAATRNPGHARARDELARAYLARGDRAASQRR